MKNKKTINRVLQLIRPYTYLVVSILVLAAVTVAATLYSPILIGKGVDCMIEKGLVSFPDLKLVLLQRLFHAVKNSLFLQLLQAQGVGIFPEIHAVHLADFIGDTLGMVAQHPQGGMVIHRYIANLNHQIRHRSLVAQLTEHPVPLRRREVMAQHNKRLLTQPAGNGQTGNPLFNLPGRARR